MKSEKEILEAWGRIDNAWQRWQALCDRYPELARDFVGTQEECYMIHQLQVLYGYFYWLVHEDTEALSIDPGPQSKYVRVTLDEFIRCIEGCVSNLIEARLAPWGEV